MALHAYNKKCMFQSTENQALRPTAFASECPRCSRPSVENEICRNCGFRARDPLRFSGSDFYSLYDEHRSGFGRWFRRRIWLRRYRSALVLRYVSIVKYFFYHTSRSRCDDALWAFEFRHLAKEMCSLSILDDALLERLDILDDEAKERLWNMVWEVRKEVAGGGGNVLAGLLGYKWAFGASLSLLGLVYIAIATFAKFSL